MLTGEPISIVWGKPSDPDFSNTPFPIDVLKSLTEDFGVVVVHPSDNGPVLVATVPDDKFAALQSFAEKNYAAKLEIGSF